MKANPDRMTRRLVLSFYIGCRRENRKTRQGFPDYIQATGNSYEHGVRAATLAALRALRAA